MTGQLPFPHNLRVDESKIIDYLLSHANGRGKAVFFLQFGFRADAWAVLAEALKAHALSGPVALKVDSTYGTRYSIDGSLQTPSGRQPQVRSVWIQEIGAIELRLITAHPV